MLQLKVKSGPTDVGKSVPLNIGDSVIIGRMEDCDLCLASGGVSKRHCRITCLPGSKLEVEDLGSSNGTFVNGLLIRKHRMKAGDLLSLHDYLISVEHRVPDFQIPKGPSFSQDGNAAFNLNMESPEPLKMVSPQAAVDQSIGEKIESLFESNIYPWADKISGAYDIRFLVGIFFLVWSAMIIGFSVWPFSQRANEKVQEESTNAAMLYARQLARVNQQAIIDQRLKDLIGTLDVKKGQTPGLVDSMILDPSKAQILAPAELLGQGLPNNFAAKAIGKDEEFAQLDDNGTVYVSVPIKIGTSEGNKTVAVSFVSFDTLGLQFKTANIIDQATSSLLYSLFASLLLIILMRRWIQGSLERVGQKIDEAMKKGETVVTSPVNWPALAALCEQVSSAMGRGGGGGNSGGNAFSSGVSDSDWALSSVTASGTAAAAFDGSLKVLAWNIKMERVIGIRADSAIGSDISEASRDLAFESAIRNLAAEASPSPWVNYSKELEFSGVSHIINMVCGNGIFFVSIFPVEG